MTVQVKPLVWTEFQSDDDVLFMQARGLGVRYEAFHKASDVENIGIQVARYLRPEPTEDDEYPDDNEEVAILGYGRDLEAAYAIAQADYERRIMSAIEIEQEQEPVAWQEEVHAPKDGTMLRLLVEPDPEAHTSFEDSENHYETIGFNTLADTGEDEWNFAGWDWSHDCFTTGHGKVVGWQSLSPSVCEGKVTEEMVERAAKQFVAHQHGQNLDDYGDGAYSRGIKHSMRLALTAALSQEGV